MNRGWLDLFAAMGCTGASLGYFKVVAQGSKGACGFLDIWAAVQEYGARSLPLSPYVYIYIHIYAYIYMYICNLFVFVCVSYTYQHISG